jgi:hypothetical protein
MVSISNAGSLNMVLWNFVMDFVTRTAAKAAEFIFRNHACGALV